jgi:hypothetical protein
MEQSEKIVVSQLRNRRVTSSQKPAAGPCPESDETGLYRSTLFILRSVSILSHLRLGVASGLFSLAFRTSVGKPEGNRLLSRSVIELCVISLNFCIQKRSWPWNSILTHDRSPKKTSLHSVAVKASDSRRPWSLSLCHSSDYFPIYVQCGINRHVLPRTFGHQQKKNETFGPPKNFLLPRSLIILIVEVRMPWVDKTFSARIM